MAQKGQTQGRAVTQRSINHGPYTQGCSNEMAVVVRCPTTLPECIHIVSMDAAPLHDIMHLLISVLLVPSVRTALQFCIKIILLSINIDCTSQ